MAVITMMLKSLVGSPRSLTFCSSSDKVLIQQHILSWKMQGNTPNPSWDENKSSLSRYLILAMFMFCFRRIISSICSYRVKSLGLLRSYCSPEVHNLNTLIQCRSAIPHYTHSAVLIGSSLLKWETTSSSQWYRERSKSDRQRWHVWVWVSVHTQTPPTWRSTQSQKPSDTWVLAPLLNTIKDTDVITFLAILGTTYKCTDQRANRRSIKNQTGPWLRSTFRVLYTLKSN